MSDSTFLPLPPSPPVVELHAWIGHYRDGGEGILSADLPLAGQIRHMPLMNSQRATALKLHRLARQIQQQSQSTPAAIVRIELRTFRAVPNA
jgi:hypothetical protein